MSGTYEISLASPKRSTFNVVRKHSTIKSLDVNVINERKVLMRWADHILDTESPGSLEFTDGVCLVRLVDKLNRGHRTLLQHTTPVLQCQKLDNYKNMLSFLKTQTTVQLSPKMNAEEFLFGDVDMQYELVWQLIQSYKLHRASEASLLKWVNKLVVKRNVRNFTDDWADGIVLYQFVNSIVKGNNPDCIYPRNLLPLDLLRMTLDIASDAKNIPPILNPYVPLNLYPSSKPLLTYLSLLVSPYISNIKRWLHNILPLKKFGDFNSCWSDGYLLSHLLEKVYPGLCKDIVLSYSHNELPANVQLSNLSKLLDRAKKSLNIKCHLDPTAIANRTAEPLSIAIFLDDIRQYSLINRPSRKLLAVQTSDYDTASIDSSTNSVTRTFSELSMGYAGSLQRRRSKSYDSLNILSEETSKFDSKDFAFRFNTVNSNTHNNSNNSEFQRHAAQRLSSISLGSGKDPFSRHLPSHLTYSLESYISTDKVDVGIREVPLDGNVQNIRPLQADNKRNIQKKRSSTRCCILSLLFSLIAFLLLLILAASSVIVVCVVGHHCTPDIE